MNDAIYEARAALFREMRWPASEADVRRLQRRQRLKLALWEINLGALFFIKRMLDILLASLALTLLSPLLLVTAIAILIEDGPPILYSQQRVGLNGRLFIFYKFRSMFRDADEVKEELQEDNESEDGVIFKMKHDPRVTRVGRFIRRYSIDELPQLLNVIAGDLTIVGPRPPIPGEVAHYTLEERKRLHVKPGLTCFWQIQGRSEIPFKEQVRLDLQYIHSQSFRQDFIIMLKTIPAVLLGKGAY